MEEKHDHDVRQRACDPDGDVEPWLVLEGADGPGEEADGEAERELQGVPAPDRRAGGPVEGGREEAGQQHEGERHQQAVGEDQEPVGSSLLHDGERRGARGETNAEERQQQLGVLARVLHLQQL